MKMINRAEFIEKIVDLFDETDPKEITISAQFRDLEEWSSLIGMGLMAMVTDEYGISINMVELHQCKTFEDISNLINSKLG